LPADIIFKDKMHQIGFRLGLRPRPCKGSTSKGRQDRRRGEKGRRMGGRKGNAGGERKPREGKKREEEGRG